jgi:hypothetical protein
MENLNPGGWLVAQEHDLCVYSDDDKNLDRAPYTKEWLGQLSEAAERNGKPINIGCHQKQLMEGGGFADVTERIVKVPIGQWARDPDLKTIGGLERLHLNQSVEAHSLALFTRVLGYSSEQANSLFTKVCNEVNDRRLHLYTVYRFLVGKKPLGL